MDTASHSSVAPKEPNFYIPFNIHLYTLVFDYIGVDKDLARCRLVSREWNQNVQLYCQTLYKRRKNDIEKLKPEWERIQREISLATKELIEVAEIRKIVYEAFDKSVFIKSMRALSKINSPSEATRDGVLAVMHLFIDSEEISKIQDAGGMDWKFFRKKLLNRNFLKLLRTIQPEDHC